MAFPMFRYKLPRAALQLSSSTAPSHRILVHRNGAPFFDTSLLPVVLPSSTSPKIHPFYFPATGNTSRRHIITTSTAHPSFDYCPRRYFHHSCRRLDDKSSKASTNIKATTAEAGTANNANKDRIKEHLKALERRYFLDPEHLRPIDAQIRDLLRVAATLKEELKSREEFTQLLGEVVVEGKEQKQQDSIDRSILLAEREVKQRLKETGLTDSEIEELVTIAEKYIDNEDEDEDDEGKMDSLGTKTPERCYADFCLIPVGVGISVAKEVAEVQKLLKASGLSYVMHSAGTTVEGSWDEVMRVIGQAHTMVHDMGASRIQTSMRVGTRTDKVQHMKDKIDRVECLLKEEED